jgi:hypothetical protein
MRRWLALALLVLFGSAALAADNGIVITPCGTGCVTTRSKDVGLGVQSGVGILGDTAGNPIYGTAGTANANVLTVQGIASMTPLLVNGSGVTQPVSGTVTANQGGTWTVQQGTPPWTIQGDSASGASNAGNPVKGGGVFNTTQPTVTTGQTVDAQYTARGAAIVATGVDAFTVAGSGTFTVAGTVTANQGGAPWQENITQFNGTASTAKASGTNAATTDTALVVAPSPNPSTMCPSVKAVNQTASTDLITSTNKLHICSIVLISATAQNLSLVEGTGTTCATGTAALLGGTTASMAVAANGGFVSTSDRAWLETQTTADHLCLLQSGTGNVSGTITYVDHN